MKGKRSRACLTILKWSEIPRRIMVEDAIGGNICNKHSIPFRIRIPNNTQVFNRAGNQLLPVRRLFCLRVNEAMVLNAPRTVAAFSGMRTQAAAKNFRHQKVQRPH